MQCFFLRNWRSLLAISLLWNLLSRMALAFFLSLLTRSAPRLRLGKISSTVLILFTTFNLKRGERKSCSFSQNNEIRSNGHLPRIFFFFHFVQKPMVDYILGVSCPADWHSKVSIKCHPPYLMWNVTCDLLSYFFCNILRCEEYT